MFFFSQISSPAVFLCIFPSLHWLCGLCVTLASFRFNFQAFSVLSYFSSASNTSFLQVIFSVLQPPHSWISSRPFFFTCGWDKFQTTVTLRTVVSLYSSRLKLMNIYFYGQNSSTKYTECFNVSFLSQGI